MVLALADASNRAAAGVAGPSKRRLRRYGARMLARRSGLNLRTLSTASFVLFGALALAHGRAEIVGALARRLLPRSRMTKRTVVVAGIPVIEGAASSAATRS
jgi:hypothetical protein